MEVVALELGDFDLEEVLRDDALPLEPLRRMVPDDGAPAAGMDRRRFAAGTRLAGLVFVMEHRLP